MTHRCRRCDRQSGAARWTDMTARRPAPSLKTLSLLLCVKPAPVAAAELEQHNQLQPVSITTDIPLY